MVLVKAHALERLVTALGLDGEIVREGLCFRAGMNDFEGEGLERLIGMMLEVIAGGDQSRTINEL